jgi:long-chain acyl-CoA synthetase
MVQQPSVSEAVATRTIPRSFLSTVQQRADETALRWRSDAGWQEWTWQQYGAAAARVAGGFRTLGAEPGDRILLMLRNRPEFYIADMGALLVGATPVSLYNSSSAEQIRYVIQHCGASIAICDDLEFLARLQAARGDASGLQHVLVVDGAAPADQGVQPFSILMDDDEVDLESAAHVAEPGDLVTVIYTSGTTGPPKGVQLTHRNAVWTAESFSRCLREPWTGKRFISYLPMAHVAERMTTYYDHLTFGSVVTTCPDPTALAPYLAEVRPNVFFGPPRVWEKLAAGMRAAAAVDPERSRRLDAGLALGRDLAGHRVAGEDAPDSLREEWEGFHEVFHAARQSLGLDACELAITGAAPVPEDLVYFYLSMGLPFSEIYGLSETCGPHTWEPYDVRPGTVGPPMPDCEVEIASDGEILLRGGNIFTGYLNDPERTAEVLDGDGWMHTGDLGAMDDAGYLRIIDRKKEIIITAGGKNVSPAGLEAGLKASPLIGQACVVGEGRPYVAALIVLDPEVAPVWARERGIENTSPSALAHHPEMITAVEQAVTAANESFSRAEQVKRFRILEQDWLPDSDELTPTMKLKRRVVLSKYEGQIEALYS